MSNIIIYSQNDCPPCTFIKNYLTKKNVDYTEKNISQNSTYRNEMMDYDAFATPFILLNNEPMYQIDMDKINAELNIE
ncbi:glutaredoxin family protein [Staphylococcus kloosii]|jgi:glutaredoxin 3|uniref:Glutaredoxin family protein n=1 Tax=Staphylococcus kloosii TaxID=29384 RepID=A0A921GY10_9STAP|nr:glutaredoxin domain-containing protein [Staphylococcus kloosii]MBF7022422.1 glutaredoxin family protein [Staphylococcus kloosii]MBF7028994.1 glutaredoxin family protein [Staphylococcus kloosii]HJF66856.1 glutaredoxin family protein [Staphylococcus kloosii]